MSKRNDVRARALLFLEETRRRALLYAEWLDPEQKRQYEKMPELRAIDAVIAAADKPLFMARAGVKLPGAHLLSEPWRKP